MYFPAATAVEMIKLPVNYLPQERANVAVPSTSERDPIVLGHQYLDDLKYRNRSFSTGIRADQVKNAFSSSNRVKAL